jgi:hypothetical protein
VDIARERGFISLAPILEPPPEFLPNISLSAIAKIQGHVATVFKKEAESAFKLDSTSIAD